MASKAKINGLNGVHTAGIYADMTVDGPEIGTLVVIVDRAKNLPNRKSIGKQDPYCAARLGKEAKKTETDRRGGQTPKWDQELRFTVHDSPDYYQLKVSVFNDDKKTDLIGETWVNLQEVVVPGGGQNDLWHNLSYKGKYAGEIRIEITYYDTRPKQEKVSDRVRQGTPNGQDAPRDSMKGPREPKQPVKRRPLPADPTGASPSPVPPPDHIQTPPRGHQTPTYINTQSPLQAMEYNIPTLPASQQRYDQSSNGYGTPPNMIAAAPTGRPLPDDNRYKIYDPAGDQGHSDAAYDPYIDPIAEAANRFAYDPQDSQYDLQPPVQYGSPPSPGGPPPPPPVHRSGHAAQPSPVNDGYNFPPANAARNMPFTPTRDDGYRHSMPEYGQGNTYQAFNPSQPQARHELYGDNNYQQSPPNSGPRHYSLQESDNYRPSPPHSAPRHHSYDERYKNYDSMQPTVESAPTTPLPHRNSASRASPYDDRPYDPAASPAPLNLSGRGSAASGRYSTNTASTQQYYGGPSGNGSPAPYQNPTGSDLSTRSTYSQSNQSGYSQSSQSSRYMNDDNMAGPPRDYVPPMPPTLVAGMDPVIAREVSERMYDNRANYNQNSTMPSRGRQPDQQHYRHSSHPLSQSEAAPAPFVPAAATYDDRQSRMATNTYQPIPIVRPRAISPGQSPDPRVPLRKSVSPSPGPSPSATGEHRRLSGVPFGPDAYDAFNPNIPTPTKVVSRPGKPDFDPEAKIIMHDGREVDPSDHLPESTWAAEPEVRTPKKPAHRPSPSGAQPMPSSGRRPLRQAGRPQSMQAPISSQAPFMTGALSDPSTPVPVPGRNRLQKKTPHRNSAAAAPLPTSSPLAPITPYQDNSGYSHRSLPRAATIDFAGENGYQSGGSYGRHGPGQRNSYGGGGGPPIPAKVPIQMGYDRASASTSGPPPAESAWALLEEMKSIDLGSGRARRRG